MNNPEPLSRFQKIDIILKCITVFGVVFALIGLFFTYKQIVETHEWNRRQFTTVILENFYRDIGDSAKILSKNYPGLYVRSQATSLKQTEANELYYVVDGKSEKSDLFKQRQALIHFLNYMEFICSAYESAVVDRDTIHELYAGQFKRYYIYFKEFINIARNELGEGAWSPIDRVVGNWITADNPQKQEKDPTGKF